MIDDDATIACAAGAADAPPKGAATSATNSCGTRSFRCRLGEILVALTLAFASALLLGTATPVAAAVAVGVSNGSFEHGLGGWQRRAGSGVTNWAHYDRPGVAHDGRKFLAFNTNANGSVFQDLSVTTRPGDDVVVTAAVRAQEATASGRMCAWLLWSANQNNCVPYTVDTNWETIQLVVEPTATNSIIRLEWYPNANQGTTFIDSVTADLPSVATGALSDGSSTPPSGQPSPPLATDGPSAAIESKFREAEAGYPRIGTSINTVHDWGGLWVQDFRAEAPDDWVGSILVYNDRLARVFVVRDGFWEHYLNNAGPWTFGAPKADEGCIDPEIPCGYVPAQQSFESGQWMWYTSNDRLYSGTRYAGSATCNSRHWESASHVGVGKAFIFSGVPTQTGRTPPVNDSAQAWDEWEDCLARPHWLDSAMYASLFDQLDCHMIWGFGFGDAGLGGATFDFESWRSPVSLQYYLSPDRAWEHRCNW